MIYLASLIKITKIIDGMIFRWFKKIVVKKD